MQKEDTELKLRRTLQEQARSVFGATACPGYGRILILCPFFEQAAHPSDAQYQYTAHFQRDGSIFMNFEGHPDITPDILNDAVEELRAIAQAHTHNLNEHVLDMYRTTHKKDASWVSLAPAIPTDLFFSALKAALGKTKNQSALNAPLTENDETARPCAAND